MRTNVLKTYSFLTVIVIFALPSACTVGPDYKRPRANVTAHFKEARGKRIVENKDWKIASPRDDFDRGEWWKIFNDKELDKLEKQLNISNQNIAAAYANYMQACALVDEARASFFPTLNMSAAISRQSAGGSASFSSVSTNGQVSSGSAVSSGKISSQNGKVSTTSSVIINASWAPDLWGLVRRTVEASEAGAQLSEATLANTRLSSQGSLAQFYFELRTVDADQRLLDDIVKNYKKTLDLTRYQYNSGVASRADIIQAQSQLESAQAQAINNKVNRHMYEHAIAILIGVPPADFSLPFKPLTKAPPAIPVTVPSELLERRPDIAQAERAMAQANAEIGVAIAAFYPTLTLTGSVNNSQPGIFKHLFSLPQWGWAYGGQLAELIFDGGLREATVSAAKAGYASSVASYRQVVLASFQNVEDNLSTLRILGDESISLNKAANSATKALNLVTNQYKAGTVPFSSVIVAQTNAYAAQKNVVDVTGLRMTAAVGLIMSLGGGWESPYE